MALAFGAPPDTDLPKIPGFEYLRDIQQRLAEAHEFARQRQEQAGARQKRGYDLRCQGRSFMPGERVWVYNPTRKKGVSPKLTSQWVGPGEVLEQLSDVVYWVKMCVRGRVVVLHRDRLAPYRPLAAGLPDTHSSPSTAPLTPTSPPSRTDSGGLGHATPRAHRRRGPPRRYQDFVVG